MVYGGTRVRGPAAPPALPPGVTLQQIDGGPSYYASNGFAKAANPDATMTGAGALGWDDPAFFPIGQDYSFNNGTSYTTFKDLGLNFTHRVTAPVDLSVPHSNGIWVWEAGDTTTSLGNETCAYHVEEPSAWTDITTAVATFDAYPNGGIAGRFFQISHTWTALFFGTLSGAPGDGTYRYVMGSPISTTTAGNVHMDIAGDDLYWFAGSAASGPQQQGYAVENLATAFGPNATADQMARGTNYGDMIDIMRTWQTSPYSSSPIIAPYIETEDGLLTDTGVREIKPGELNWAAWATIIHGARGLLYFSATSNFGTGATFGFSQSVLPGESISVYTQGKNTNTLVTNLARILNSPFALGYVTVSPAAYNFPVAVNNDTTSGWSVTGIDVMAKYYSGGSFTNAAGTFDAGFYIFATYRGSQTATSISATFTLAGGYSGTVHAINADGGAASYGTGYTLTATGGTFTDTFAKGSSVRIYRIG